jgi:hypothetical protein
VKYQNFNWLWCLPHVLGIIFLWAPRGQEAAAGPYRAAPSRAPEPRHRLVLGDQAERDAAGLGTCVQRSLSRT